MSLQKDSDLAHFKATVIVHLDAAYNLARWLTRDEFSAEEAVQDACLRAFRAFGSQRGPNVKAWFMAVVRNASLDWIKQNKWRATTDEYDEELHSAADLSRSNATPEADAIQHSESLWLRNCIAKLPHEYREVIVLRELEDLPYKEISAIVNVPIGTVMSRLARGRDLLQQQLTESQKGSSS